MPEQTGKYEILVAVDGSPESDAAVRWVTREAELRELPITLAHVVVPVVTSWPVRSLQAEFNEWQEDNARQVLEQAQKMLRSTLGESELPNVRTEVLHDYAVPALVKASKQASDARGRQPRHGCLRPRGVGFRQQRCGPPCALPSRDRPCRRSTGAGPHLTRAARH